MPDKRYRFSRRDFLIPALALLAALIVEDGKEAEAALPANATVDGLRCEYQIDPLGIEEKSPRLSWMINSSVRGWQQSAYQVLAASRRSLLDTDAGDLWDSGKVTSRATHQIAYPGQALLSRQECYWKVRVWDSNGAPSDWSKPARWEMGLLSESDWSGSVWIGKEHPTPALATPTINEKPKTEELPPPPPGEPAPYLRREFSLTEPVQRARLYVCGLGFADVHLNGKRLGGNSERDPAYTAFDRRVLYVTHDVTRQVKSGKNALGVVLGTGWYDVHDRATWNFDRAVWRGAPCLRLMLLVEYKNGRTERIVSDDSWKMTTGPIRRDGIYTGEVYDARLEMPGWDKPGFPDEAWTAATVLSGPKGRLVSRYCPPIAITQTLKPVAITEPKSGIYVLDFGQNFSGHIQLRADLPAGTTITVRYGEKVHPDGMLDTSNIDYFMAKTEPRQPFQSDTYISKGGKVEWEPRFCYNGFQYVEVTGFPGKPTPEQFLGRFAHTAVESAGEFMCSSELFNKIQHATRWAYLSNAQSIPTDCPQREKNGWTGDAHLASEAGLMNFHSATFYTKWLDDLADEQQADGRQALIVPTGNWGRNACHPAWDSAYLILVWDLYRYKGDTRVIKRHYEHMRRYVDYLTTRTENGTIAFDSLGDWLPWKTETPSQLTSTAYLYHDAHLVAQMATLLGRAADARKYTALADATHQAFNAKFFDAARNSYANGSQTALATPLFLGMVPEESRSAVLANLVALVEKQGHIDTGIIGAKYVLRALSEAGRVDLAYLLAARKEQPGWGWWIEQGATTLYEDWKGEQSLNHIMFGDISNWFYQWVAGIGLDANAPGFGHILIRPHVVGDLTWARATYDSPHGKIVSDWKKEQGKFTLKVTIPPNATATVRLPANQSARITESGKPVDKATGVRVARQEADHALCEVGSGNYTFVVAG